MDERFRLQRRFFVTTLFLVWLAAPPAWAQITTGGITGTIVDEKGEPFPGVLITARNSATGFERSAVTGNDATRYSDSRRPPTSCKRSWPTTVRHRKRSP